MPKSRVRSDALSITLPPNIRGEIAARDDEINVYADNGRIVLPLTAEDPSPGEMKALYGAEAAFAQGSTLVLDDVLRRLRKAE